LAAIFGSTAFSNLFPAVAQHHISCRPVAERTGDVGCWILRREVLGRLPPDPLFWHLDTYPTRGEAEANKKAHGTIIEAASKTWLLTIAPRDWRAHSGQRVGQIGPLPMGEAQEYVAVYMEAMLPPGFAAPIHRHPGPEAIFPISGEVCIETPDGRDIVRPGHDTRAIPGSSPMALTVTGSTSSASENLSIAIREIRPEDVESCAVAAYAAHSRVAAAHNVPCEHPSVEFSMGLIGNKLKDPNAVGFAAEREGRVIGSVFLNLFPKTPAAAIGPLTVDPAAEGSAVGQRLMHAAMNAARDRGVDQVRLVQSPSHLRSLALYSKLGFEVREPLVLFSGPPLGWDAERYGLRVATMDDIPGCDRLCTAVHGFARTFELRAAIEQKTARVVERGAYISGYSTGLGLRGHAVGDTTEDLKQLIGTSPMVIGPGFFAPLRNGELLRWLLANGFRASWPAFLMTRGSYKETSTAFMPSIAF